MQLLSIRSFVHHTLPKHPYERISAHILPRWTLSLVFAGRRRAQSLNKALRKKDYVPNVLSYKVGEKHGEIVICPDVAKRQAKRYGMSYSTFLAYLFIHGCLHLKGHPHGTTMERREQELLARFIR